MKLITEIDVENKKVILRCDYNVSIKDGKIVSNKRIVESLETINYLIRKNAKIIIMSHLGKVKEEKDKKINSLKIVYEELTKFINTPLYFSEDIIGKKLEEKINNLKSGEVLLIENTRFADLDNKKESNCDIELSKYWASLADIFINDAFGMIHRSHASNYGISKYLPSVIGFLIRKELDGLEKIIKAEKPFTVIMSGAKLDDKIFLIKEIIQKCDYLLLGGGIANTFLSINYNVGSSLISSNLIEEVKSLYERYKDKIILPIDATILNNGIVSIKEIDKLNNEDKICDIGSATIINYENIIKSSKTIFLNGTVGIYEDERFRNGTQRILKAVSESRTISVIGGGDALSASEYFNIKNFYFISTGGGATLYYLAYEKFNSLN